MFQHIRKKLKPAKNKPTITDPNQIASAYKYWRMRIFISMYTGYVFFYFTRKSFASVLYEINLDLGISCKLLGLCGTVFYVCYGISKFISGMLSDISNPRYFMSFGLIITGILNILFGMSSSIYFMILIWGANGIFQGWGWPPVAKQLTHWFAKKERGTWWSLCSTSHNVGGGLIPIICAMVIPYTIAGVTGWRLAMFISGGLCIACGLILLDRLRDIPTSLGLPSIEAFKEEDSSGSQVIDAPSSITFKEILFEHVLENKFVWVMAFSYFFVYVVRTGMNDWTITYLVQNGFDRVSAGGSIAWFEVGGFIGTLLAGWASDYIFSGRRAPFSAICALGIIITLYFFTEANSNGSIGVYRCYSLMFAMGFFIFGPQMLIGLAAAEYVDKKAAGTANGFVGCFANAGAAMAGAPLGMLIDNSWNAYFSVLMICSIIMFCILFPLSFMSDRKSLPRVKQNLSKA